MHRFGTPVLRSTGDDTRETSAVSARLAKQTIARGICNNLRRPTSMRPHPDDEVPQHEIRHRGRHRSLTQKERQLPKRRQAIEPVIGHLKSDHHMNRCHLKVADRRCHSRDTVRGGIRHEMAAADDCPQGDPSFFAPRFRCSSGDICHMQSAGIIYSASLLRLRSPEIRPVVVEMNSSGTTTYGHAAENMHDCSACG